MGNYVNYQNVIDQLQAFGLMVNTLEVGRTTTKRVAVDTAKCPVDKEKRKSAGWYKLNAFSIDGNTYIVGSFGYWKGSDNNAVKVEWKKEWSDNLTPEQRQAMADAHKASIKLAEAERKREIEHCANMAQTNWLKLKAEGESGYLARKQVGAFGIKFHPKKDLIAVPVIDIKGKLFALQLIRSGLPVDSKIPSKQFWPRGAEIKGHFHTIGNLTGAKVIFIAEGYATGASIHQATGAPVVVAFNANNLTPVAKEIAKANKYAKIVICADDDYLTDGNPGVTQAQNAALSVGGEWVKPDFMVAGTDIRNGEKLTDFNDLHVHPQGGLHLVTAQLAQYLTGAQPKPANATSAGGDKQGEGESRKAVSVMSVDAIVERFVYVDDETGRTCFDTWTKQLVMLQKVQSLLPPKARWEEVKAHPLWQSRAAYKHEVGFDPSENDKSIKLNMWSGWPMQPKAGSCEKLLELLWFLVSEEENAQELFVWVMRWLAYPLQHPGAKMKSAIVVHGPQGTGKSRFFEAYAKIYGEYSLVMNQGAIEDKFNADWTSKKLFIVADEVVASAEKFHLKNQLKGLITGETIRVNPKNVSAHVEKNQMNLVFLSNEKQPVVLENDDRRHCVIWTPPKKSADFYAEIDAEIESGGIEALYHKLLALDLGDFKPWTLPPMTVSKKQLIDINIDTVEMFINEWSIGNLGLPVCPVSRTDLYKAYESWCRENGEKFPRPSKMFYAHIDKLRGWVNGFKDRYETLHYTGEKKRERVIIPSDDAFSRAAQSGANVIVKKENQTIAHWVTDGIYAFANARENK